MTPKGKPDWIALGLMAMDDANLGRVLAAMGFTSVSPAMPRLGCAGFEPPLARLRPWRARMRDSNSVQARGWQTGHFSLEAEAAWDRSDDAERAVLAATNRARAGAPARLCRRESPPDLIWLDEEAGEWAHAMGGARGGEIVSLGMFMWGCRFGQAGWRIARACGLPGVPMERIAA